MGKRYKKSSSQQVEILAHQKNFDLLCAYLAMCKKQQKTKRGVLSVLLTLFHRALKQTGDNWFDPYHYSWRSILYKEYYEAKQIDIQARRRLYRQFYYLREAGYVKARCKTSGCWEYVLTSKGRIVAIEETIRQALQKKEWDGKWRILIFDVPEGERRLRDQLRTILRRGGFHYLQKSVWITPYDVYDEMAELLRLLNMRIYAFFLVTEEVIGDEDMRVKFGLE